MIKVFCDFCGDELDLSEKEIIEDCAYHFQNNFGKTVWKYCYDCEAEMHKILTKSRAKLLKKVTK